MDQTPARLTASKRAHHADAGEHGRPAAHGMQQRTFLKTTVRCPDQWLTRLAAIMIDDLSTGRCSTGVLGSWRAWKRGGRDVQEKTPTPILLDAILRRVAEIDHKFKQTDTWLHPTLAKDARERELLVAKANEQFNADLKHEWR